MAADKLRRGYGNVLAAIGPHECSYRVTAAGTHWRLREYDAPNGGPTILIVAAPIKRPYIWDLAPSVSAIRYCLQQRQQVYLLEWLPASLRTADYGLEEYVGAIGQSIASLSKGINKPILMGHSLGGTLAVPWRHGQPARWCC